VENKKLYITSKTDPKIIAAAIIYFIPQLYQMKLF
jgi:hypothetical protein